MKAKLLLKLLFSCSIILSGCAGKGKITVYERNLKTGEFEQIRKTEFEGQNIDAKTSYGDEMNTKTLEFPQLPSMKFEN